MKRRGVALGLQDRDDDNMDLLPGSMVRVAVRRQVMQ
jgi:hypothetical protein